MWQLRSQKDARTSETPLPNPTLLPSCPLHQFFFFFVFQVLRKVGSPSNTSHLINFYSSTELYHNTTAGTPCTWMVMISVLPTSQPKGENIFYQTGRQQHSLSRYYETDLRSNRSPIIAVYWSTLCDLHIYVPFNGSVYSVFCFISRMSSVVSNEL